MFHFVPTFFFGSICFSSFILVFWLMRKNFSLRQERENELKETLTLRAISEEKMRYFQEVNSQYQAALNEREFALQDVYAPRSIP